MCNTQKLFLNQHNGDDSPQNYEISSLLISQNLTKLLSLLMTHGWTACAYGKKIPFTTTDFPFIKGRPWPATPPSVPLAAIPNLGTQSEHTKCSLLS